MQWVNLQPYDPVVLKICFICQVCQARQNILCQYNHVECCIIVVFYTFLWPPLAVLHVFRYQTTCLGLHCTELSWSWRWRSLTDRYCATQHRTLLPVISASHASCLKWNIKLFKTTKNLCCKCRKVANCFLLDTIEILWKFRSCCIISLDVVLKRVMGGCVNSDWIDAEVCYTRL